MGRPFLGRISKKRDFGSSHCPSYGFLLYHDVEQEMYGDPTAPSLSRKSCVVATGRFALGGLVAPRRYIPAFHVIAVPRCAMKSPDESIRDERARRPRSCGGRESFNIELSRLPSRFE